MKRWLLAALMFLGLASAQAQYVTLTGTLQGSNGTPADDFTISFTPTQWFYVAGQSVTIATTTNCATSIDGSVVGLPNPLANPVLVSAFSPALSPGLYYVEYSYYTASTETLVSPEAVIQLTSTGEILLDPPTTGVPTGALGMRVYIGTSPGAESLQGQTTGNTVYAQTVPLVSGSAVPGTNNTACQQIANDAGWPTGTGYKVALTDSAGNSIPGYPMVWQLLGPNTTINLSNGVPYYNGQVTFPSPILASPYNHNPQSISGPLNMQGYPITNVGRFDACSINGSMVNAGCSAFALQPDMGARVNAAIASCAATCTVYVPPGVWAYSTTIVLPMNIFGHLKLELDPGATLNYNGSGDAIITQITSTPTLANLLIEGGELLGNPAATSGIHIKPSQKITIRNMMILQFSGGDAVLNEGANGVNIYDNTLQNNQVGVHQISTFCNGATPVVCVPSASTGQAYSPNGNHVHDNTITNNSHWAIFEDWNGLAGSTGPLNNDFRDNILELNGSGGPTFGAVFIMKSVGDVVANNYFEASPREVVLGQFTGGAGDFFGAISPVVRDNYFTTSPPTAGRTKAYNIELENTLDALIEGNTEQGTPGISSATNCYINAETGGEQRTFIGRNGILQGVGNGSGNPICINGTAVLALAGNGSMNLISQNFNQYLAFQNFATTAVTSETIPLQFVTATGSCSVSAINNAAAADTTAHISGVAPGSATFVHAATANEQFNVWCANKAVGGFGYP